MHPSFLIIELFKHKNKIRSITQLDENDFLILFSSIIEKINFVPVQMIEQENRGRAYDYCKNIDLKDIPFVALSLEVDLSIWTGDNKLKRELLKKGFDNFISFN